MCSDADTSSAQLNQYANDRYGVVCIIVNAVFL